MRPAAHVLSFVEKKGRKETSPGCRAPLRGVPCVARAKWRPGNSLRLRSLKHARPCFHLSLRYSARQTGGKGSSNSNSAAGDARFALSLTAFV